MGLIGGVHLLPATGEFTYDTVAHTGALSGAPQQSLNAFFAPAGTRTDYAYAIDQLQAAYPECSTVSVVCAWFGNSVDASQCQIYPATNFVGGSFQQWNGAAYVADTWRVSGLTQMSSGLIPLPTLGGQAVYGGTPSDQSIVRCIRDLKSRGYKVVFYPFVLMTAAGFPWRGRIATTPDISAAATNGVNAFLGNASRSAFTADPVNLTVAYSGSPTDYSYRRMILHYAWLCTVAGGVNLFLIGSELRGLETIRGPAWTPAGSSDVNGNAVWDYPFVAGLKALAGDVRAIFDGQGLTRNVATLSNLVTYSADWSDWMGYQHPGANGQWPHLDALWSDANIDVVGIDNYLPLSDWTTGDGGLDARSWLAPAPSGAWPPSPTTMNGLGLSGPPTAYSLPYLKGGIEGGEKFSWWYSDGANSGPGRDPNGTDLVVSLPQGDRLQQARSAFAENQQTLANKQFRWWWKNTHQAVYDNGDGQGWVPRGPQTQWLPESKPLSFVEYGYPATDKGTNQPNVFFDAKSTESATPYWSI
jgi:GTA TIM-barrel-like domain